MALDSRLDRSVSESANWIELDWCPICQHPRIESFEVLELEEGRIHYQLCSNCGTVYQSPRMSEQTLTEYYQSEYVSQHQGARGVSEKELRVQAGRARHLVQMLRIHRTSVTRHLDIGSSTGVLLEAVQEAYDCEGIGIEPAEIYQTYAAARGLEVYPSLAHLSPRFHGGFDLVTMAHVLEHLPDPISYLREMREMWLSAEGILMVEVPNLFGHFSLELPHLFCFHSASLRRAFGAAGYSVVGLKTHGKPRSRLIPLYLTAIAKPMAASVPIRRAWSGPAGVRLRRKAGMIWNRLSSRLATRWAWLPLPEMPSRS